MLLLPIQLLGFYSWRRHSHTHAQHSIKIKSFTPKQWGVCILLSILAWITYQYFLKVFPMLINGLFHQHITADPTPYLDALVSVCTVVAMLLTAKRYLEQWWFWIGCNIIGVILFIEPMLHSTLSSRMMVSDLSGFFNWLQYGFGSAYGLYLWKKRHKEANKIDLSY